MAKTTSIEWVTDNTWLASRWFTKTSRCPGHAL